MSAHADLGAELERRDELDPIAAPEAAGVVPVRLARGGQQAHRLVGDRDDLRAVGRLEACVRSVAFGGLDVAELTDQEPGAATAEEPSKGRRFGVKVAAKWLWRQGRMLVAISDELEKRPHGRFYHRALGMVPVVGMAGDYLGERSGLKRAAKRGRKWIDAHAVSHR